MEAKVTLCIHPPCRGGMKPVSRTATLRGKQVRQLVCWFDPPGVWNENSWNVHIDGCDYECETLDECKAIPPRIYDYKEVEYIETDEAWEW